MNDKLLNQNIDRLNISCKTIELLKYKQIILLKELCTKTKTNLKNLGISTQEINKIEVELQLIGLNLKSNY